MDAGGDGTNGDGARDTFKFRANDTWYNYPSTGGDGYNADIIKNFEVKTDTSDGDVIWFDKQMILATNERAAERKHDLPEINGGIIKEDAWNSDDDTLCERTEILRLRLPHAQGQGHTAYFTHDNNKYVFISVAYGDRDIDDKDVLVQVNLVGGSGEEVTELGLNSNKHELTLGTS